MKLHLMINFHGSELFTLEAPLPKVDYKTGAVVAKFEPEELVSAIPELAQIANIDAVKLGNMFSDDIRCQHWNK